MLKNKKILLTSLLFTSFLEAKTLVNGVCALVNNEPITLYEIHKLAKQKNIDTKQSLNILIQNRLEQSQAKKLGIEASSYEVDKEIDMLAKKNGISKAELLSLAKSKGLDEEDYRLEIANGIKTKKLYSRIFRDKNSQPNKEEVMAFYEANKHRFSKANDFDVTVYLSKNQASLQQIQASPMSVAPDVKVSKERLNSNSLDKRTQYFLNQTPQGSFTPIMKAKDGYVMFLVGEKSNASLMDEGEALPLAAKVLSGQKQKIAVKNYFEKLRSSANIEILRKP